MATKSFGALWSGGMTRPLAEKAWGSYLLWIVGAALLGFAIAAIFAGLLHWPRAVYLIPYVGMVGVFFYAFLR